MIDVLIILVIVGAFLAGYRKGLVKQLGSIAAIILAWMACMLFGDTATEAAQSMMSSESSEWAARAIGMGVLFFGVWIAVGFVARMLHVVITAVHLGVINNLGGAALMILKAGLVLSILLNIYIGVKSDSELARNPGPLAGQIIHIAPALI